MAYIENVTKLPLHEILKNFGYFFSDKSKNTNKSWELNNSQNDKIIVTRYDNGDYVYFKRNSNDRGNIINFCRNRGIELSDLLPNAQTTTNYKPFKPIVPENTPKEPKTKEVKQEVIDSYKSFKALKDSTTIYLNLKRKISTELLKQFSSIKHDKYHNAVIPTYFVNFNENKEQKLQQCGYMTYYHTPITKDRQGNPLEKPRKQNCSGSKGLEILLSDELKANGLENTKNIVIAESVIDSLSAVEIKGYKPNNTLICATNGAVTPSHIETIEFIKEKVPNAKFILAFDNDKAGKEFANQIKEILPNAIAIKPILKDFNDDLMIAKEFNIEPNKLNEKTLLNLVFEMDKKANYFIQGYNSFIPSAKKEISAEIKADLPKFALLHQKAQSFINFEKLNTSLNQVTELLLNGRASR